MTRRILPLLLALPLCGFGCGAATNVATEPEVRVVREAPPAATSTPEAPPPTEAAVYVLPPVADWPTWSGTWFDVKYPPGFTARTGATGCIEDATCDSAFFTSPDGKVEFYVMSPLWGADAGADVALKANERLVDDKTQTDDSDAERGPKTTHWVTVAARDGSYTRSWVEITDDNYGSRINHVFGIKYADAAAYAGWRDAYLAFKSSLVQYAD